MIARIFILWSILFLGACSLFQTDKTIVSAGVLSEPEPSSVTLEPPLALAIIDELNDGNRLYVRGRIGVKGQTLPSSAVLRLIGLNSGEPKEQALLDVSKIVKPGNSAGEFTLSIGIRETSDYQIELLWGKDSEPYVLETRHIAALVLSQITLAREQICNPDCREVASVHGTISNSGDVRVTKALVGLGFVWAAGGQKLDLSGQIPENEQKLDLTLDLAPGRSRQLKFDLDQELPQNKDGTYLPVLRIISAS